MRPLARLLLVAVSALVAGSVVGCDTRAPVGGLQDGGSADTILPRIEGGVVPPLDLEQGIVPPGCTCLDYDVIGYSCCISFDWGCKENPRHYSVCGIPDPCLVVGIDPKTGCDMPVERGNCTVTCYPQPPPPPPPPPAGVIGRHCTKSGGECGTSVGVMCLLTHQTKGGVCTSMCTPDDPNTPLLNEDSCPVLSSNICGAVGSSAGAGALNVCFRRCDPQLGANACSAPLACDPLSSGTVGLFGQAVCLRIGCQTDHDCPILTDKPCQLGGTTCETSEICVPAPPSIQVGFCAKGGVCDQASGLCAPRKQHFQASAKVGDPCRSDLECGANQRCELEANLAASGQPAGVKCTNDGECCGSCVANVCVGPCVVHARNGYCVVEGCAHATLKEYQCATGSSCNRVFPAGLCQRDCDPKIAASCRGEVGDKLGDYECRAWNNISIGGKLAADRPVCDFGDQLACNRYGAVGCDALGLQGNPTKMSCRDLNGAALADPRSPSGLCLDDTASGPAAP